MQQNGHDLNMPWPATGAGTDPQIINLVSEVVQAINRLERTMASVFPVTGTTTTTATLGDASALPATPEGYMSVTLPDGTAVKVPFYLP